MYVCLDCEILFKTPTVYTEKHGLDSPPYEMRNGCPSCGGSYVKAMFCDGCEVPIVGDYAHINNGLNYCENCVTWKNIQD